MGSRFIMKRVAFTAWIALVANCLAQDWWEQKPIRYLEADAADPASQLAADFEMGAIRFKGTTTLERMKEVLALLHIPESSQILVFSKTSKQNPLIGPDNPRALYFSEDAYAAFVPGGKIELASNDPILGPVFHVIDPEGPTVIRRETHECLACHGTARTEGVPGVLVRSVFPDLRGSPNLGFGSVDVDATTPLALRWGGYYVTGSSSLPHLGNRTFPPDGLPPPAVAAPPFRDLAARIDLRRYPRATSDIVALLVLEHQCHLHNLMTSAGYRYRRNEWMLRAFDPAGNADRGSTDRLAAADARTIVDAMLFKDAATLGEGVEGDDAFQQDFEKRFPKSSDGRSLAQFHLGSRLFKYRCSYMIYSRVFASMPAGLKSSVFARLVEILEAPESFEAYGYLGTSERKRIAGILRETVPEYRALVNQVQIDPASER